MLSCTGRAASVDIARTPSLEICRPGGGPEAAVQDNPVVAAQRELLSAVAVHETLEALEGFFDLLVSRGIARPRKTLAPGAE